MCENGGSLKNWINSFQIRKSNTLGYFIYGPHGCGKTTTIKSVCEQLLLNVFEINQFNATTDLLTNLTRNKLFGGTKEICIVIENIEQVCSSCRKFNSLLCEVLDKKSSRKTLRPIVITSITKPWGSLDKVRKLCILDQFYPFSYEEIKIGLLKENFCLDSVTMNKIIQGSGGDYNFATNQTRFHSLETEAKKVVFESDNVFLKTDRNMNIFDLYRNLIVKSKKSKFGDVLNSHFFDTHKIPLFVQENYLSNLHKENPIENAMEISDLISEGDIFDGILKKTRNYQSGIEVYRGSLSTVIPLKKMSPSRNFYFSNGFKSYFPSFPKSIGKDSKTKSNWAKVRLMKLRPNFRADGEEGIKLLIEKMLSENDDDEEEEEYDKEAFRTFPSYESFKFFVSFGFDSKKNKGLWKSVPRGDKIKIGKFWNDITKSKRKKRRKPKKGSTKKKKKKKGRKKRITKPKLVKKKKKVRKNQSIKNLFAKIKKKNKKESCNPTEDKISRKRKRDPDDDDNDKSVGNPKKRRRRKGMVKARKRVVFP